MIYFDILKYMKPEKENILKDGTTRMDNTQRAMALQIQKKDPSKYPDLRVLEFMSPEDLQILFEYEGCENPTPEPLQPEEIRSPRDPSGDLLPQNHRSPKSWNTTPLKD